MNSRERPILGLMSMAFLCVPLYLGCNKKLKKDQSVLEEPTTKAEQVEVQETTEMQTEESFSEEELRSRADSALMTVYFDFEQADLRADAIERLEAAAAFLSENRTVRIRAEGHCDERGTSEYNIGLGEKRAQAVKQWITAYGIDAERIETTSWGEEKLAQPGCATRECHQKNRRVEWVILEP